ncbi:MAG: hypothetical protein RLZZ126_386 [Pseudomonadota bacterium]
MMLNVQGQPSYCYTGGRPFDAAQPTVAFIHGAINDHSVWILQSRYLAHHGFNVLAVDLPGHCRSSGPPPATVQEAAGFIIDLLDAAGVKRAALVGHSFGSLIALEAAARAADRISQLVLIGTAAPMKVSTALLEASVSAPVQALTMVNVFSRATLAAPPSALGPGTWVYGNSFALGKRVIASNRAHNLFHVAFKACNDYADGESSMAKVQCPTLFILGHSDQMTPPKAAQGLIRAARDAQIVTVGAGHHQMTEAPEETLAALRSFLR